MKTAAALFILLCCSTNSWAQANVTLSNLSQATKINASLKPKTTGTFDLGKPDSTWKNLYLNGSVFLNGKPTVASVSNANDNLLFGAAAGANITTGIENIAVGNQALNQDQTGAGNIAIGKGALFINSASFNTTVGDQSMINNTTGSQSSAFGYQALFSNTAGQNNNAFGYHALFNNNGSGLNGFENNAFGNLALLNNTTGSFNSAMGNAALFSNTSGASNTAVGSSSLLNNNSGNQNTALGASSLSSNTTGSFNTAVGLNALNANSTQAKNTAIGYAAGNTHTSSASTFVGFGAITSIDGVDNSMALGFSASVSASNQIRVGSPAIQSIGGFAGWTDLPSDGRFKQNVKENVPGLNFIKLLRPITYTIDVTAINKKLHIPADNTTQKSIDAKAKEIHSGFIAQEVEAAAKKLSYDFNGVDAPKNDDDIYGLRYAEFVVPLVKAVQELSRQNDDKDKIIADLNTRMNAVENKLNQLLLQPGGIVNSVSNDKRHYGSVLEQNTPNPFSKSTIIQYTIPDNTRAAALNISSSNGQLLQTISIATKGAGQIHLDGQNLAAGTYDYTLIIDGTKAGSKKMIVIK